MSWPWIVGIVVLGVLILWFMYMYNELTGRQRRIDEWWDEVDSHLKLRHDLIPLLTGKARILIKEESDALDRLAELSEKADNSNDDDFEYLENGLSIALHSFKRVVRDHSTAMLDLDFLKLMGELVSIEGRASSACKEHNHLVGEFNMSIRKFPANLVVGFLHFNSREMRIFAGPEGEAL
jgi:LemA protein